MRTHLTRRSGAILRLSLFLVLLPLAQSGCDVVAAYEGTEDLSGYWAGPFDPQRDFYLQLVDHYVTIGGKAGFAANGTKLTSMDVVGQRLAKGHLQISLDDPSRGDPLLFDAVVVGKRYMHGTLVIDGVTSDITLYPQ
jgi:hypothetical protein